jgi:hypothetical protein
MQQYMPGLQIDICSDVGNELLSYAQWFKHGPPTVGRIELVAALQRLRQHCLAGVRRASCCHTMDVVGHVQQGDPAVPPPPPPLVVGSGGRARSSHSMVGVLGTSAMTF